MARIWNAPIDYWTDAPLGLPVGTDDNASEISRGAVESMPMPSLPEPPMDVTHAPAVRAFLADRQDGQFDRQKHLARAVLQARCIC